MGINIIVAIGVAFLVNVFIRQVKKACRNFQKRGNY